MKEKLSRTPGYLNSLSSEKFCTRFGTLQIHFVVVLQEQFVQYLALYAYKSSKKDKKELTYNDLADCVENSETFQFLADILPKKILASEYLKMLEEERAGGGDRDEEDGDEEDDEEEDDNNEQDEDEDENES
uniref:Chromatin accessibility complex subunit 1 n=1 Tax=Callorhinchus milii TaxID=7868 RepID=A0A4W3K126_CALMI